jgi:hypothetical protein
MAFVDADPKLERKEIGRPGGFPLRKSGYQRTVPDLPRPLSAGSWTGKPNNSEVGPKLWGRREGFTADSIVGRLTRRGRADRLRKLLSRGAGRFLGRAQEYAPRRHDAHLR